MQTNWYRKNIGAASGHAVVIALDEYVNYQLINQICWNVYPLHDSSRNISNSYCWILHLQKQKSANCIPLKPQLGRIFRFQN